MPVLFANPWGLLALLGLPVVLAVHFLHRHRKSIPVSTLFLIEIAREPAQSGRRWHRLINSTPLWLQLLLVILIAALLARPYRPQGVIQVAIVVDDSASMLAFRSNLAKELNRLFQTLEKNGQNSLWHIYSANPSYPMMYSGEDPQQWINSLDQWKPGESWRDPVDSLRLARNRVGTQGLVVYATDTPTSTLPSGVATLSVGTPLENVGIAGVTTKTNQESTQWEAIVVNHSNQTANRQWALEWNGTNSTQPQTISLEPKAMVTLSGELPEAASRLVLRLEKDNFPLDDHFPFVHGKPKPLKFSAIGGPSPQWMMNRLPRAIPRLGLTAPASADFALLGLAEGDLSPNVAGIHFSTAGKRSDPFIKELATPTSHPLVAGLAWAGLSVQDVAAPEPMKGDEVLLWAGDRPLASLRQSTTTRTPIEESDPITKANDMPDSGPRLILHFNPALSNMERLPAAAIMMVRYAELIRSKKQATTWAQLEPGQNLRPVLGKAIQQGTMLEILDATGQAISSQQLDRMAKAPKHNVFIRVRDTQTVQLEGAVAFADPREGNFLSCLPLDTTEAAIEKTVRASIPSENALLPIISLASIASLLALYHFQGAGSRKTSQRTSQPVKQSAT